MTTPPHINRQSTVIGTAGNLINAIVGAGIVGIAYAIKEAGLVAGTVMVVACAIITEKSLRILIETAKLIGVTSYETLFEATFGRQGFYFVSIAMFVMSYGGMVSYLIIIKDTLPRLLGYDADDDAVMSRWILVMASFIIIFPLSSQRDMADLAKTSTLSVIFDIIMVLIVVITSPIPPLSSLPSLITTDHLPIIRPSTIFIGLGVLSFAFVCQHSAFIIHESLIQPTMTRWGRVTRMALSVCGVLATLIGVAGYLGFGEEVEGNVLNNLDMSDDDDDKNHNRSKAAFMARGLVCTTMFFVYPVESFVARHAVVALFFRREDDDGGRVLDDVGMRVGLTLGLYMMALVPALIFDDLGMVLSLTGAIGGSALSYIGPGCVYLGAHGSLFLGLVEDVWGRGAESNRCGVMWCILGMPLWCRIAKHSGRVLMFWRERKSMDVRGVVEMRDMTDVFESETSDDDDDGSVPLVEEKKSHDEEEKEKVSETARGEDHHLSKDDNKKEHHSKVIQALIHDVPVVLEDDDSDDSEEPMMIDFVIAICYIIFGVVAATAGIVSILEER